MFRRRVIIKETNLLVKLKDQRYFKFVEENVIRLRAELEHYILKNPYFLTSLTPIYVEEAPEIIKLMSLSSIKANVGPMASVAGAIAELSIRDVPTEAIADNGGDIALKTKKAIVGLYSGSSPISGEIGFLIKNKKFYGVCTSSATVGHSISFGNADSVTVFAKSPALADASATAICNVTIGKDKEEMIQRGLERADNIEGIDGVFIVVGELVGVKGKIPKVIKTDKKATLGELFDIY
ncbi:ApbE family lipoprotein [Methanocaldococcus infernus ME]|uniref:UPF0280 protein Metin_1053 n=1 Tax=Methanocaldococcus infernus (strain DSM 11812 / JCM 15783 / ME) TaxID=573063 RepID=D5VT08_METIM|nr:UPF0280 family protein [Methanocaldococcus infernus]ADG13711.1 ApbE family lipoprotein [Methanocaldococcus infernus ME]